METKTVSHARIARSNSSIRTDIRNMLYVDGVCIGKVDLQHGTIQVKDRDRRRSSARGGDLVTVSIRDLAAIFGLSVTEVTA